MSKGSGMQRSPRILPDFAGLFGLLSFSLLVIFDSGKALIDGDTLWHIKAGSRMLKDGAILTRDVFSHTALGKPWTAHEWLAEIIMAWLHQHAGLVGVVIFYFLLAALSFWLLFRIVARIAGDRIALFCVSIAFAFSQSHMLARPHIFSWLLGVLTLYLLQKQGKYLLLLPPMLALWANLHGGFILGLALQGLFIAGGILDRLRAKPRSDWRKIVAEYKNPLAVLILSVIATGLNPFGYRLLLFPFQVTSDIFASGIVEWLPPNMQQEWLFRFYLLLFVLLATLKFCPTTWTDRLFLLFFFNASLTHQRYIGLATVFLSPFLARALVALPWLSRLRMPHRNSSARQLALSGSAGPVLTLLLACTLIILANPAFPQSRNIVETFLSLPDANHPSQAVRYLNQTRPEGRMFNKYSWGGYLIYALDPPAKVFIDGRADMYGEKIFGDYQKIVGLDEQAEQLLETYRIAWVLYPTDSALVRYLKISRKWRAIYSDETASILVREEEKGR